jgi:hypothetical protein
MGTGKDARQRRVVYEYSFKRSQHDNRAINKRSNAPKPSPTAPAR